MSTSKRLHRAAALLCLALFAGSLHAQFADQSITYGINTFLPQSVLNNPQIVLFYWSPNWNASSTWTEAQINQAVQLMVAGDGVTAPYFQKTSQYTDTALDKLPATAVPVAADTSLLNASTNCGYANPGASVNSITLTTWVDCMLNGTGYIGITYPPEVGTPDVLPVFFLPSGSALNNDNISVAANDLITLDTLVGTGILAQIFPNGISVPNGCSDFYGYHFWTSVDAIDILNSIVNPVANPKLRLAYAILPLACFGNTSQLALDVSGFYTGFDDLTEGIAHELVEGMTDPFLPLGFIDFSKTNPFTAGEAADLCYPTGRNVWYQNQVVAAYWSIADNACVAGNNTLSTVTLSATFRNDGPATAAPPNKVQFHFDVRSGNLVAGADPTGNNYTFPIQVVNGTTHSYSFPSPLVQGPGYQLVTDGTQPLQGNAIINAPTGYTVNYKTQYFVSLLAPALANASPPGGYFDIGNLAISTAPTYTDQAGTLWQFFNWTGTATVLTTNFVATVNQSLFYQAQYVRDVSSEISFVRSGLTYNRATQTYYGTLTVTNNGTEVLSNLLPVALTGLPAGVTMTNAAGTFQNNPYVLTTTSAGLPPGASNTIPIQFKITGGTLNYGVSVYSFH